MNIRTVLAVLLAVALCSVSLPAIDHARTNRAAYRADAAVTTVSHSMTDLANENAVPFDDAESNGLDPSAARRVVSLSLPPESATMGTVDFVAIGGVPGNGPSLKDEPGDVLAYRVQGGGTHVRHVPFDVRVATRNDDHGWSVEPDGTPLLVHAPDRTDIALLLVEYRGKRTVLVIPAAEL